MKVLPEFDRLVSLVDAAKLLGVHAQTLRKAVSLREITVVRLVRAGSKRPRIFIRLSALDRWIKAHEVKQSRLEVDAA